ncbi:unnamed protein product, partial [marine sediment metagenome]
MAYTTEADIKLEFGKNTVDTWANLSDDGTETASRISRAIIVGSEEVDDALRSSRYQVPLIQKDGAGTPTMVGIIATILGGLWLHSAAGGVSEEDGGPDPYALKRKW